MSVFRDHFYPPELVELMVEALSKLTKSKDSLLNFFEGAGAPKSVMAPHWNLFETDRARFKKPLVARKIIMDLNEGGDQHIAPLRELLKRVVEFEDYHTCYEENRLPAQGLVAKIRDTQNRKDSVTRIDMQREELVQERRATVARQREELARVRAEKRGALEELQRLFGVTDAHARGKALERVLNRIFALDGIAIEDAFVIRSDESGQAIEQIDGAIKVGGVVYLVEMKWCKDPVGPEPVGYFVSKILTRGGGARGIVISYRGFTQAAVGTSQSAMTSGVHVVLSGLQELCHLLEQEGSVADWLARKFDHLMTHKEAFWVPPAD